jgi:hypothetical protein
VNKIYVLQRTDAIAFEVGSDGVVRMSGRRVLTRDDGTLYLEASSVPYLPA